MLSILIPTYNRAHLISETVSNALASIGPDDEVIIRDNASTDGSVAVLEQLGAGDARIRLVLAQDNCGPVGNWHECLKLARGEHVKLLFSDDLMLPDAFREFHRAYLSGGYEVGFSAALIGPRVEQSQPEFIVPEAAHEVSAALFRRLTLTHLGKVPVSPSAFVFSRALLHRSFEEADAMLRDRPEARATGAGIDLLIVTLAVEHAGRAAYTSRSTVFFRQHAGSISTEKARLVKQLYNLSRVRFAKVRMNGVVAVVLAGGYPIGDAIRAARSLLRRRRTT